MENPGSSRIPRELPLREIIGQKRFRLGRFTVYPHELKLESDGHTIRLQQKEMHLLLALAEQQDKPVSSDTLRQLVWQDQAIADGAAKNLVWQLRQTLAKTESGSDLIETVPGAGYRLTQVPQPLADSSMAFEENGGSDADGDSELRSEASRGQHATVAAGSVPRASAIAIFAFGIAMAAVVTTLFMSWRSGNQAPQVSSKVKLPRPIGGLPGREFGIDIDASGRLLLFSWTEDFDAPSDLYRFELDAEAASPVRLTHDADTWELGGKWSADGQRIAFVQSTAEPQQLEIRIMRATGGSSEVATRLTSEILPTLDWQDDDTLFVAFRPPKQTTGGRIHRLKVHDGEMVPLGEEVPCCSWVSKPTLSSDQRRLAFIRWTSPLAPTLRILDLDSGKEMALEHPQLLTVGSLDWNESDRHLVFTSMLAGSSTLWTLAVDGSSPPTPFAATAGALDIGEATVAHQGTLAFEQSSFDVDMFRYDGLENGTLPDSARPQQLVPSDRAELAPRPSPDGRSLAFLSNRRGGTELWLSQNGGEPRRLPIDGVLARSFPSWSPDGSMLALTLKRGEQHDLALVHAADDKVDWLTTTDDVSELMPAWSHDGLSIRFSITTDSGRQLWQQALVNPEQRMLLAGGGEVSQQLADGRLLYSYDGEGLWLLEAHSDPSEIPTPTLLPIDIGPKDGASWYATSDGIYFLPVGTKKVRYFDFANGQTREVIELPQPAAPHGLRVSADGKSLFVATVTLDQSRVLIVAADSPAAE